MIIRIPLVKGRIRSRLYDLRGSEIREHISKNVVVLAGLNMMAKAIQYGHADQGKTIRYLEIGSGLSVPGKTDTALGTTVERMEIDSWDNTDNTSTSDPVIMIAEKLLLTTEGNGDLTEAGLFQGSSGAPMFCRGRFLDGDIIAASKADPCVIQVSAAHSLIQGDKIRIQTVGGMVELNGNDYYVDVESSFLGADEFALYSDAGLTTSVDSSGYTTYTSGGEFVLKVVKTSGKTLAIDYSLTFPAA